MPIEVPRWIYPHETCIKCGKRVALSSHCVNIEGPESFVEVHYHCPCGMDNGYALTSGYVGAYQKYLDEKKKEEANGPAPAIS